MNCGIGGFALAMQNLCAIKCLGILSYWKDFLIIMRITNARIVVEIF